MIKILIVEDDPMVAELNRRFLAQIEGFSLVGMVANGLEALKFLEENEVDLILLDIFMPHINGLELLSRIRAIGHGVDVIMVTAARNSSSIQSALRQGVVDYLIKPFEFERLYAALMAYKNRSQIIAESDHLNQSEIDNRILAKSKLAPSELPKGLDRTTLSLVIDCIKQCHASFTTEQMAQRVGVSRVSLRKYLEFLKDAGVVESTLEYRSVGRPVAIYKYSNKDTIV